MGPDIDAEEPARIAASKIHDAFITNGLVSTMAAHAEDPPYCIGTKDRSPLNNRTPQEKATAAETEADRLSALKARQPDIVKRFTTLPTTKDDLWGTVLQTAIHLHLASRTICGMPSTPV